MVLFGQLYLLSVSEVPYEFVRFSFEDSCRIPGGSVGPTTGRICCVSEHYRSKDISSVS